MFFTVLPKNECQPLKEVSEMFLPQKKTEREKLTVFGQFYGENFRRFFVVWGGGYPQFR